ncbi:hypothetical protein J7J83_01870, partial [bacterium]|nr:hypothetical protein [bacterium]
MTDTTVERLSAHDRSIISKDILLRWYRAKRTEKLQLLRDEIIKLSATKREVLKKKIVENTKRELAAYRKELTPRQREMKAKQFADELFRTAIARKSLQEFARKYELRSKSPKSKVLYKHWLENGKTHSVLKESPRYLVTLDLNNSSVRKEAFLLLGIIEKHWSRDEAMRVYKACWDKYVFSLQPMWEFFSKEKAGSELGFYYGTRKILVKPDFGWGTYIDPRQWGELLKPGSPKREYTITGWWTVDENEKNVNKYTKIKTIKKRILKMDFIGDEYTGSKFLYKSISHIRREYRTSTDSGLTKDEEKAVLAELDKYKAELESLSKSKVREKVFNWFIKQPRNVWLSPSQKIVNLLSFLYGYGTGNYLYRYVPDKKRIYIIPLQGANIPRKYFGGYLTVKSGRVGKKWKNLDSAETKDLMISYIKTMKEKDIDKEIIDSRLENENTENISY